MTSRRYLWFRKMKAKGFGVNRVARELTLTLFDYICRPLIATHIAGVTNNVANTLCRKHLPGWPFVFPTVLNKVKEYVTPSGDQAYIVPSPKARFAHRIKKGAFMLFLPT